jgi:hypothetical protein
MRVWSIPLRESDGIWFHSWRSFNPIVEVVDLQVCPVYGGGFQKSFLTLASYVIMRIREGGRLPGHDTQLQGTKKGFG